MAKNNSSVDGFIPRRSRVDIEHAKSLARRQGQGRVQPLTNHLENQASARVVGQPERPIESVPKELVDSLSGIDDSRDNTRKPSRRERRKQRAATHPRRKTVIKRLLFTFLFIVFAVGIFVGIRTLIASGNIFKGNIFSVLQTEPLAEDMNGRTNIVIFGTAEDSEGGKHGGANLTDSIMVLSVDQTKKDAYMFNIPRDLWVEYEEICTFGNEGKVNAVYTCASDDGADEGAGAAALQRKIGEVTGLDIQYYAHINFSVVVDAVDAVGGIDLTIESDDPRGILDRNFDWKCNYQCYYVNYENGERVHLDGEHALALARARNAQGGYGLSNGNFSREQNQQKIIVALKDKALSAGTLTNIGKVTGLIDAMGNNLRTNFETKEIRTIMTLAEEIPNDRIVSISLADEEEPVVTTGMYYGQSIVRPIAGIYDYSGIQTYISDNLAATPMSREKATLTVLNGSGVAGLAATKADELSEAGFRVPVIDNAPEGSYGRVEIYQVTEAKPETAKALASFYGVQVKNTLPADIVAETDFVIIYGEAAAES